MSDLTKGTEVLITYISDKKLDWISWKILGKVNDTLYTIIDNRDNIYWFVDIKDIKTV